ncbi:hypothetical protein AMECASPLE_031034 [Ameca splendens]|uniref:Uncharacterized protein n=1 Tax=Ameca splendens TaxID=208324 RepID=A0ABV1AEN8_9TELE
MRRVDPQTLETKEKVDWSQYIAVNSATAHPHYDHEGATYNMGNSYSKDGDLNSSKPKSLLFTCCSYSVFQKYSLTFPYFVTSKHQQRILYTCEVKGKLHVVYKMVYK